MSQKHLSSKRDFASKRDFIGSLSSIKKDSSVRKFQRKHISLGDDSSEIEVPGIVPDFDLLLDSGSGKDPILDSIHGKSELDIVKQVKTE